MQRAPTPSSVWRRRTNRMVAATIIFIGLTMMISNITQCIYIGMLFIVIALVWLAWLTMKERKLEPPRPEDHPSSPVLFLVTSQMLPRVNRPTVANPSDKPPSYDQIVSLDGLPPDYSSIMTEKPPRYEDLQNLPGPSTVSYSIEKEVWQDHQSVRKSDTLSSSTTTTTSSSTTGSVSTFSRNFLSSLRRSNSSLTRPQRGPSTSKRQPKVNNQSGTTVAMTDPHHSSAASLHRGYSRQPCGVHRSSTFPRRELDATATPNQETSENVAASPSPLRLHVGTLVQDTLSDSYSVTSNPSSPTFFLPPPSPTFEHHALGGEPVEMGGSARVIPSDIRSITSASQLLPPSSPLDESSSSNNNNSRSSQGNLNKSSDRLPS